MVCMLLQIGRTALEHRTAPAASFRSVENGGGGGARGGEMREITDDSSSEEEFVLSLENPRRTVSWSSVSPEDLAQEKTSSSAAAASSSSSSSSLPPPLVVEVGPGEVRVRVLSPINHFIHAVVQYV